MSFVLTLHYSRILFTSSAWRKNPNVHVSWSALFSSNRSLVFTEQCLSQERLTVSGYAVSQIALDLCLTLYNTKERFQKSLNIFTAVIYKNVVIKQHFREFVKKLLKMPTWPYRITSSNVIYGIFSILVFLALNSSGGCRPVSRPGKFVIYRCKIITFNLIL